MPNLILQGLDLAFEKAQIFVLAGAIEEEAGDVVVDGLQSILKVANTLAKGGKLGLHEIEESDRGPIGRLGHAVR